MKRVGLLKISGINLSPILWYGENQNWNKPVGAYLHHERPSESDPSFIEARGKTSSLGKRRNDGEIQERGNYIANFEKKKDNWLNDLTLETSEYHRGLEWLPRYNQKENIMGVSQKIQRFLRKFLICLTIQI